MKEIYAETRVSRRNAVMARRDDGRLRIEVIGDLARSLAEELLKNMDLRQDADPETGDLIVRASVMVAEPSDMKPQFKTSYQAAMEAMIAPPIFRPGMNFEGYINLLPGGEVKVTDKPMMAASANQPATLTQEKLNEAIESMKKMAQKETANLFLKPLLMDPMMYLETRMDRKRAQAEGEASAVAKARGDKEVRENTKKRGATFSIEVGVRKITMPEKETG